MEAEGCPAVPSTVNPAPLYGDSYFSGGHNVKQHGSRDGGIIDAIQVEAASDQRASAGRPAFVAALAKAIQKYLLANY